MNFEQWWKKNVSCELKRDVRYYHSLTKNKIKELALKAGIEKNMSDIDVWIFSQPIANTGKVEFFFNWRKGYKPSLYTTSLGQKP